MQTIKGPAIFLAQFPGESAPFDSLDAICGWAASLGYEGVQLPTWDGAAVRPRTRPRRARTTATRSRRRSSATVSHHRARHPPPGSARGGAIRPTTRASEPAAPPAPGHGRRWAWRHDRAPCIASQPGWTISTSSSRAALPGRPSTHSRAAAEFGVAAERAWRPCDNGAAGAASDLIDVVAIVTPNHLHLPVSAAFLDAGFDVIRDKPLTATLAEADELARRVPPTPPRAGSRAYPPAIRKDISRASRTCTATPQS